MIQHSFKPFEDKMKRHGISPVAVNTFRYHYGELMADAQGFIEEKDISRIDSLPHLDALAGRYRELGKNLVRKTVIMKLNGGLGTSMGMECAKSLLPAKSGMCFLEISARQARYDRLPLILMDSFATLDACEKVLNDIFGIPRNIPRHFMQNKVPKILRGDLTPAVWPENPELEWCPPGHGDIYTSIVTSGILELLLDREFRYAFVSNADNLGAVMDPAIPGYMAAEEIPFLMEAAFREEEDRKGGHLARSGGNLVLRELAQCRPDEIRFFQDNGRHKFFNTNNIWIDLRRLKELLEQSGHIMRLPLIRNEKTLDPRDGTSPAVYQLETAMGSALSVFENAGALAVPRSRFRPVKTTNDLFLLNSDIYALTAACNLKRVDGGRPLPTVHLDPQYYRHIDQMQRRFSRGIPSMMRCSSLHIEGDVYFEQDVRLVDSVRIVNKSGKPVTVKAGAVIEGELLFD